MTPEREIPLHALPDREILILTATTVNTIANKFEDHEKRLRTLERFGYVIIGAWGFLATWLKVHILSGK
jgi:hypothetical protein